MRSVGRHEATARELLQWEMGTNSYRRPMEQTTSTKKESIVNPSVDRARSRRRAQAVAAGALSILLSMVPTAYVGATAASAGPNAHAVGRAYANTISSLNANASGDLNTLIAAHNKGDVPGMQQAAASYSKALVTWDAAVAQLRFPAGVHRLVDRLHSNNHTEVDDLAAVGRVPVDDPARAGVAADRVLVDDDADTAAQTALERALGRPGPVIPAAVVVGDRLLLADNTYTYKDLSAQTAFNTADGGKDLGAAKSATASEKKNLQALLSSMNGVDFPASVHADVVKVGHAAGTLRAFYQRRLLATNYPALHALGPNDTYLGTLLSSMQTLINDLGRLAS